MPGQEMESNTFESEKNEIVDFLNNIETYNLSPFIIDKINGFKEKYPNQSILELNDTCYILSESRFARPLERTLYLYKKGEYPAVYIGLTASGVRERVNDALIELDSFARLLGMGEYIYCRRQTD